ncbi:nickel-dependent hydrogenase large subunit [Caminibacter mediatlanticus]|uniref:Nickel-dependent hydrogenase, large subunit n=1 Tax=Caminibacter mediatlanticus TB-2 TaxID=391592 RepID=A0AAI9F2G4_9BACT|nr:nickel-dependent hydrogenase large subunit [Caminibacter mediatlanticus]EDM23779.1 Nickel-dependent hydrogenase, large subunit [Caminibacter mediatlanticus TB-2]
MANKIVIDPITRIEGHLRIEVVVDDNNIVTDAYSSSTMFRGIEPILKGRDPRDCGLIAMRICGVCTVTHYQRSIEAVENAYNIVVPKNARLVRNLIQSTLFMHDHLVHYYHLHSLDWIDVISALNANENDALNEATKYANIAGVTPYITLDDITSIKAKLKALNDAGKLGIFSKGYWGNSSYKLTPAQNLMAITNYFKAFEIQRFLGSMMATLGGKDPHPQSIVVGGVTSIKNILDNEKMTNFYNLALKVRDFIKRAYIPDMYMLADVYKDDMINQVGGGLKNFLVYGGFPLEDGDLNSVEMFFPQGVIYNANLDDIKDFDANLVTEDVTHAWYSGGNDSPYEADTIPNYTGFKEVVDNVAYLDTDGKYSWIKSPLYNDERMEVGPLARMLVGYKKSNTIKTYMQNFLDKSNTNINDFISAVGRTIARAIESEIISDKIFDFFDELKLNLQNDTSSVASYTEIPNTQGFSTEEAPRGALGHWVRIENSKVANYQTVVPSTWNAAPRDYKGRRGAYEESLIGVKLSNIDEPLEILRVVHSFDPCIACAVHVMDVRGKKLSQFNVNSICGI